MTSSDTLLETRDLGMWFGGVQAVDGVNFRLGEGELRCLIGPNGAGKSTFFKLLTGQLAPTEGTVLYRGRDISGAQPHEIARMGIGIKTQVPSVFDGLSVRENIWVAANRARPPRRAAQLLDEILSRIAMTGDADRLVGQLAHGQRQWVEPAAGMTHEEVARTAELIRDINRTRSLIVVEHDMQFIRMIASRVTVLDQGRVLVEDSMENILRDQRVRDVYLGKRVAA